MCLILLAWRMHPDYPLVVAANRDEFFARPTAGAGFWADHPAVLAGRDLEAGGTWMGVTRSGRFATLTNYRSPQHHQVGRPSRGKLVADFLTGSQPPERYLRDTADFGQTCNGYNLLVGDGQSLYCASNVSGQVHALEPGVYGLSNHLLDTPWPKVGAGRTALEQALGSLPTQQALFDLLGNELIHPDEQLPATGVPLEWERLLSAAFIRSADYGTRTSTVLCCRTDGMISYDEQTWTAGAARGERRRFCFRQEEPTLVNP
jgi:uncharacterized protein with NRDE domain